MSVRDLTSDMLQEVQQAQIDSAAKRFGTDANQIYAWLADTDPTPNRKYSTWILKQWKREATMEHPPGGPPMAGTRTPSSLPFRNQLRDALSSFDRAKKSGYLRGQQGDVNFYKSYNELSKFVAALPEEAFVSKRAVKRGKADPLAVPGSKVVKETENYKLVRSTSLSACMFHGKDTDWCTRATGSGQTYMDQFGSMFVVYRKTPDGPQKVFQYTPDYLEIRAVDDEFFLPHHQEDSEELFDLMKPVEAKFEDNYQRFLEGGHIVHQDEVNDIVGEWGEHLYDEEGIGTQEVTGDTWVRPGPLSGTDSDHAILANVRAFKRDYEESDDVRFGSWGYGGDWVEVRLGTEDHELISAVDNLRDYPIYDEDLVYEIQNELQFEAWRDNYAEEFSDRLIEKFPKYEADIEADFETEDAMKLFSLWQRAVEGLQVDWEYQELSAYPSGWTDPKTQKSSWGRKEQFSDVAADTVTEQRLRWALYPGEAAAEQRQKKLPFFDPKFDPIDQWRPTRWRPGDEPDPWELGARSESIRYSVRAALIS